MITNKSRERYRDNFHSQSPSNSNIKVTRYTTKRKTDAENNWNVKRGKYSHIPKSNTFYIPNAMVISYETKEEFRQNNISKSRNNFLKPSNNQYAHQKRSNLNSIQSNQPSINGTTYYTMKGQKNNSTLSRSQHKPKYKMNWSNNDIKPSFLEVPKTSIQLSKADQLSTNSKLNSLKSHSEYLLKSMDSEKLFSRNPRVIDYHKINETSIINNIVRLENSKICKTFDRQQTFKNTNKDGLEKYDQSLILDNRRKINKVAH